VNRGAYGTDALRPLRELARLAREFPNYEQPNDLMVVAAVSDEVLASV
jgi:hypothetical protein